MGQFTVGRPNVSGMFQSTASDQLARQKFKLEETRFGWMQEDHNDKRIAGKVAKNIYRLRSGVRGLLDDDSRTPLSELLSARKFSGEGGRVARENAESLYSKSEVPDMEWFDGAWTRAKAAENMDIENSIDTKVRENNWGSNETSQYLNMNPKFKQWYNQLPPQQQQSFQANIGYDPKYQSLGMKIGEIGESYVTNPFISAPLTYAGYKGYQALGAGDTMSKAFKPGTNLNYATDRVKYFTDKMKDQKSTSKGHKSSAKKLKYWKNKLKTAKEVKGASTLSKVLKAGKVAKSVAPYLIAGPVGEAVGTRFGDTPEAKQAYGKLGASTAQTGVLTMAMLKPLIKKYGIKWGVKQAAKLGAGGLLSGSGIGTALGIAMLVDSGVDIYKAVQEIQNLKQENK